MDEMDCNFCSIICFFPAGVRSRIQKKDDYTILVYMIGSDMESDFQMASDDIKEMMDAGSSSNINVVLQTGEQKSGRILPLNIRRIKGGKSTIKI